MKKNQRAIIQFLVTLDKSVIEIENVAQVYAFINE
jgi:hypothetical protein